MWVGGRVRLQILQTHAAQQWSWWTWTLCIFDKQWLSEFCIYIGHCQCIVSLILVHVNSVTCSIVHSLKLSRHGYTCPIESRTVLVNAIRGAVESWRQATSYGRPSGLKPQFLSKLFIATPPFLQLISTTAHDLIKDPAPSSWTFPCLSWTWAMRETKGWPHRSGPMELCLGQRPCAQAHQHREDRNGRFSRRSSDEAYLLFERNMARMPAADDAPCRSRASKFFADPQQRGWLGFRMSASVPDHRAAASPCALTPDLRASDLNLMPITCPQRRASLDTGTSWSHACTLLSPALRHGGGSSRPSAP